MKSYTVGIFIWAKMHLFVATFNHYCKPPCHDVLMPRIEETLPHIESYPQELILDTFGNSFLKFILVHR